MQAIARIDDAVARALKEETFADRLPAAQDDGVRNCSRGIGAERLAAEKFSQCLATALEGLVPFEIQAPSMPELEAPLRMPGGLDDGSAKAACLHWSRGAVSISCRPLAPV